MISYDQEFDARVHDIISQNADPILLASMTEFDWDQFGFAPEGTRTENLKEVFGQPFTDSEYYTNSRNLFVFMKDGKAVKALMVSADYFDNSEALTLYSNTVKVGFVTDAEYRPDLLHFVE